MRSPVRLDPVARLPRHQPRRCHETGIAHRLHLPVYRVAPRPRLVGEGRRPRRLTSLRSASAWLGISPSCRSAPSASTTATAIESLCTSIPTYRVSWRIGSAPSYAALHRHLTRPAQPTALRLRPVLPSCLGRLLSTATVSAGVSSPSPTARREHLAVCPSRARKLAVHHGGASCVSTPPDS